MRRHRGWLVRMRRQRYPVSVDLRSHALQCVQHAPVGPHQNDVAVTFHYLGHQAARPGLAVKVEDQDTLPRWLPDVHQPGAAHPFSEEKQQWRLCVYPPTQFVLCQ